MKKIFTIVALFAGMYSMSVMAKNIGSVDSDFSLFGSHGSIEVDAMKDPEVQGITCYLSYAKRGGVAGDIECRQTGPLILSVGIEKQKDINAFSQNLFFKQMLVTRMFDKENKTLIYLVHSKKLIDGSPYNAISTIPLMDWSGQSPVFK